MVGDDLDAIEPYYLFKNMWGANWGEKGYYKMKIGDLSEFGKSICLITNSEFNVKVKLKK